jgi:hypothetical protein
MVPEPMSGRPKWERDGTPAPAPRIPPAVTPDRARALETGAQLAARRRWFGWAIEPHDVRAPEPEPPCP